MNIIVCDKNYSIDEKVSNILEALFHIKKYKNHSLAFRSGCKSGVCGSCAIKVDGIERLACKTPIKENIAIKPISNLPIIKDLIVDIENQKEYLKSSKAYLEEYNDTKISKEDEKKIDIESNCILCNSCFSSCPVYDLNLNFKGPFALTRVFRYIEDKKEKDKKSKIDIIQDSGIWNCTLCGNCDMVCPANIQIKNKIIHLRNLSAQFGYNDPNFANFNDNLNFGFNPNGF